MRLPPATLCPRLRRVRTVHFGLAPRRVVPFARRDRSEHVARGGLKFPQRAGELDAWFHAEVLIDCPRTGWPRLWAKGLPETAVGFPSNTLLNAELNARDDIAIARLRDRRHNAEAPLVDGHYGVSRIRGCRLRDAVTLTD